MFVGELPETVRCRERKLAYIVSVPAGRRSTTSKCVSYSVWLFFFTLAAADPETVKPRLKALFGQGLFFQVWEHCFSSFTQPWRCASRHANEAVRISTAGIMLEVWTRATEFPPILKELILELHG